MIDYDKALKANKKIAKLDEKIRSGKGGFKDVHDLAAETGKIAADVIEENISERYPDGNVSDDEIRAIVSPILRKNHEYVTELGAAIINKQYQDIGVGLKATIPKYDLYRETGIVWKITNERRKNNNGL